MNRQLTGVFTKVEETESQCLQKYGSAVRQASTQLDFVGYFSPRLAVESSNISIRFHI